jgi:signal transduction histidine kinase/CheY-like chemotaxis protein
MLTPIGLLPAYVLVGIVGYVGYQSVGQFQSEARLRSTAEQTLTVMHRTMADLRNTESAQRTYVITGDINSAVQYRRAVEQVYSNLEELDRLLTDPGQRAMLTRLMALASSRIESLDLANREFEERGFDAARDLIQAGAWVAVMDSVVYMIGEMASNQLLLADQHSEAALLGTASAGRTILLGTFLTAILLLGAGMIIDRDIRRSRTREKELQRARDEAYAANQAKSQFLATVSHEIRTPLNGIIGMTELIRDTVLTTEQAAFTRTVQANAEALQVLINGLLDSARIETGHFSVEEVAFDLRDVIDSVLEILSVRAEAKRIDLVADIDRSVPERFRGDPNRLRQVLMNLVANAIKFTEEGEVVMYVMAFPEGPDSARQELHLAVRDTGIGIDPEDQTRIFERFVQAKHAEISKDQGAGLGLNISRALVELMGGRMELDSKPGEGSTFRIVLPLTAEGYGEPRREYGADVRDVRVLLVAGNASVRRALTRQIENTGVKVVSVSTAAEGLGAMRSQHADGLRIAIIDERLPDGQGFDLVDAFDADGLNVSVILLCAPHSPCASRVSKARNAKCVHKPVKHRQLVEVLDRLRGVVPIARAPAGAPGAKPGSSSPPMVVLVAEDNLDNLKLTTSFLQSAGYRVKSAENGKVAADLAASFRYDLILMDLEMPVMDGFEATVEIRAAESEAGRDPVPIVALSAHSLSSYRQRAREVGMDDFASKPIRRAQLLEVAGRRVDSRAVVLVADDSPDFLSLIGMYLKSHGYRFVTATNGSEALDAFRSQRISMILLDMNMPVMDGYETARAIRDAETGKTVPIVAITGHNGASERQKCLDAGCSMHLAKPFQPDAWLKVIAETLASDTRISLTDPTEAVGGGSPADPQTDDIPIQIDPEILSLVPRFLAGRGNNIVKIRKELDAGSFEGIRVMGHEMKGSGESFGFTEITRLGAAIEEAALAEDAERVARLTNHLEEYLRRIKISPAG